MIRNILDREQVRVALVAAFCSLLTYLVISRLLHVSAELAAIGPPMLFLGYLVSSGWTPHRDWPPGLFWSASLVFAMLVEIAFAYTLR